MFEILFLGLASWLIYTQLGGGGLILPLAVGAVIGLFTRGSLGRVLGSVFALLASVLPAAFYALSTNWTGTPVAIIMGGKLFAGYMAGTLLRIVTSPFRWLKSAFGKVKR